MSAAVVQPFAQDPMSYNDPPNGFVNHLPYCPNAKYSYHDPFKTSVNKKPNSAMMSNNTYFPAIQAPSRQQSMIIDPSHRAKRTIQNRQDTLKHSRAFINKMRENQQNSKVFGYEKSDEDEYKTIFMDTYGRSTDITGIDNIHSANKFESQESPLSSPRLLLGDCWKRAKEVKKLQDANGKRMLKQNGENNDERSMYKNDFGQHIYGRPWIYRPKDSKVLPGSNGQNASNDAISTYNLQYMDSANFLSHVYNQSTDTANQNMMKNSYPTSNIGIHGKSSSGHLVSLFKNDFTAPPNEFKPLPPLHEPRSLYDPISQQKIQDRRNTAKEPEAERICRPTFSAEPYWLRKEKLKERALETKTTHFSMGTDQSQYETEHKTEFMDFEEV